LDAVLRKESNDQHVMNKRDSWSQRSGVPSTEQVECFDEEEDERMPLSLSHIGPGAIQEGGRAIRLAELVLSFRLRADRDEEQVTAASPWRHVVRKRLSSRQSGAHGRKVE
jgi:hypothetical protein